MIDNPIKIDKNKEGLNQEPLVSIVIPTHNRDYLLPRALESALNQSYKNIEVVVVSDGSTDKTDEIMHEYETNDTRVKYISYKPGKGGNYARNTGIQNSNGEYVAFLDDDDEWYPEKIQKQLDIFLSDSQIGLVCTGINSIQEGEDFTTRFIPPAVYDSSKFILLRNCIGSTTTVMVRRELFNQSGMFDEQLGALQDYDLWVRLCQICKVGVVKEPCVDYWNYKTSGQISGCTDKYEKAVEYLEKKYEMLVQNLTEDEKKRRRQYFILLLAKKAMRNGDKKLSRKYVRQARKIKLNKEVIACYLATFFSDHFVNKIKSIVRKKRS